MAVRTTFYGFECAGVRKGRSDPVSHIIDRGVIIAHNTVTRSLHTCLVELEVKILVTF